jgi:hypothetical protein
MGAAPPPLLPRRRDLTPRFDAEVHGSPTLNLAATWTQHFVSVFESHAGCGNPVLGRCIQARIHGLPIVKQSKKTKTSLNGKSKRLCLDTAKVNGV